ncbi:helix-turn-helix transcriptional regulator [Rhodoblastus acidophilus]|uniref:Helix-turn-helix transcriptional regulator n=1 Tax=Candidatus Rhodoblastus alkanivorans TaxID=2954117 RepID=A0ABS9Z7P3_9HYPH|nr:helix-turn-helix transcriptional regulator [Candidatus Rhodoblastus alkanivorans]MCI4679659.1 helix-turn-helix transcriptional regulator [Candidatus Rhodoblastus alkanivorans]MCI4683695.1 helix-turn-helix transcriptional regulator [Candidatus Rhodoblastus alkanivorans]MDI4641012.1 helix-turn-helix transcriptional regulator [Rhodoblastus acidophilus]
MKPQIITTPSGEELVVIPRAEYDAMIAALAEAEEDAADVAIYDARKAELARDAHAALPEDVSAAVLRGASLLTAVRKWKKLTQQDLAGRLGMSQGYLSDLESGRRKGTPETMEAIANALDVPRSWFE